MLFPSTLIISPKPDAINDLIASLIVPLGHLTQANNPDIYQVAETGDYTVENVRQIKKFLSQKPFNHSSKIVIVKNAHLLNIESQNTLLKSLEEPLENNYFILATDTPGNLLSTIISRCHLIRLSSPSAPEKEKPLKFPESITQSLALSDSLVKDKSSLLIYLQTQISIYQKQLVDDPTPRIATTINKLIKCTQMLNANVDPRSALDYLLLS